MTQNRLSNLSVPKQFSEFIRDSYPRFVDFLKTYYKFLDEETRTGRISKIKDIDSLSPGSVGADAILDAEFIQKYRREFAIDIPQFDFLESKRFILFSRALYEAKGTEDALRFLYRAAFNSEIEIEMPKDAMLRASDGRWYQEHFFEVDIISGEYDNNYSLIYEESTGSPFIINPIKQIHLVENEVCRFYVSAKPKHLFEGANVYQKNEAGNVIFFGLARLCPGVVSIINPGKYWKPGQLISIKGTHQDSFLRVTKTSNLGEIISVEAIDFGYSHHKNHYLVASPYTYKPQLTTTSISKLGTVYTLNISDTIDEFTESVQGSIGGSNVIDSHGDINPTNIANTLFQGITIQKWEESRATIEISNSVIGTNKGLWKTEDGHLSNDGFRLQDNFFYQAFSYLITTPNGSKDGNAIIKINHPAGLMYFTQLGLFASLPFNLQGNRTLSRDVFYVYDSLDALVETLNIILNKGLSDTVGAGDEARKVLTKGTFTDTVTITDPSGFSTSIGEFYDASYVDVGYSTTETTITLS